MSDEVADRLAGTEILKSEEIYVHYTAIIDKYAKPLQYWLGLDDWKIYYKFRSISNAELAATCNTDIDYKVADIEFDSNCYLKGDKLLDDLYHELVHVQLALLDIVRDAVKSDPFKERMWTYSVESTLRIFERTWANHGKAEFLKWLESSWPSHSAATAKLS